MKAGPLIIIGLVVAAAGLTIAGLRHGMQIIEQPVDPRAVDYVGSAGCRGCHDDRHDSWYRTFHRTMTQEARPDTVQGAFDGRALDYQGIRMRPVKLDGRYFFEYHDLESGRLLQRVAIHRTVGSHRYQQYLTRIDDTGTYVRLHWLWHNGDRRWVHMNAAFLGADGQPFDQHTAIWNQNCIFCHNTGIEPRILNAAELTRRARAGEPVNMATDTRFASVVAELGIACESCHGPGAEHVRRAQDFRARQAMRLAPGRDRSIVNPVRLPPDRGSQVCAQCHAQRVPADPAQIMNWMTHGPSYRPGDELYDHVIPVTRELKAPIRGQEDLFRDRFWADGTPRLTAYEYQGLRASESHRDTDLSCMDCHTMHAGDPRGQMIPRQRGDAPCLRCHLDLRDTAELQAHTRHPPESDASRCYSCHMPRIVYGVMDIHASHRIEIPDPGRDAATARPNACLNCHLDRSAAWAATQMTTLRGGPTPERIGRADGLPPDAAEADAMIAGDPVQKAVLAWHAGRPGHAGDAMTRLWLVPYLIEAMRDRYPSTRRFARASLIRLLEAVAGPDHEHATAMLAPVTGFDFIAPEPARADVLDEIESLWLGWPREGWPLPPEHTALRPDYSLDPEHLAELRRLGRRADKQINVGE